MRILMLFVKRASIVALHTAFIFPINTLAVEKDNQIPFSSSSFHCQNDQTLYNPFEKSVDDLESLPAHLSCLYFHKIFVTHSPYYSFPKMDQNFLAFPYNVVIVIDPELPLKQALSQALNQGKAAIVQRLFPHQPQENISIIPDSVMIGNGYDSQDIDSLRKPEIWTISAKSINLPRKTLKASHSHLIIRLEQCFLDGENKFPSSYR